MRPELTMLQKEFGTCYFHIADAHLILTAHGLAGTYQQTRSLVSTAACEHILSVVSGRGFCFDAAAP
jgi:hypothetical protein